MRIPMITISQMNVLAGRPDKNLASVLRDIDIAKRMRSDLHVLNEMAIPGYMLGDEWENNSFVQECESMNQVVIDATKNSAMTVIWGNVATDSNRLNQDGRLRKYNAAFVACSGILVSNGV